MVMGAGEVGRLKVNLALDSGDFTKNMAATNRSLKLLDADLKAAESGLGNFENGLDQLKTKSANLTQQFQIQQTRVQELNRRYEELVRTKGENSKEAQNMLIRQRKAVEQMRKVEKALKGVNDKIEDESNQLNILKKRADEAAQQMGELGQKAGAAGSAFTPVVAGIGAALLKIANDVDSSQARIQAQLGVTGKEAEKLTKEARDIWSDGFGESMEDVTRGLVQVKHNIKGLNDGELKKVTKDALVLADVFEADVNEVTRAGGNVMKGFGVDSKKAFDLMAYGAQNGLNFSNEMFDNLSEYAPLFAKMGFSADEYFQLLINGSEAGVYNLDYINDAMKEMQIRLKDGSKTTSEAMGQLSSSTQQVWKDYLVGKSTVKDVSNAVLSELKGMDDQTLANQIGVDLYGTKWEDLESDAMYALGGIDGKLKGVDGSMQKTSKAIEESFGVRVKAAWRESQEALEPLGEILLEMAERHLPKIEKAVESVATRFDNMSPAAQDATLAIGGLLFVGGPLVKTFGWLASGASKVVPWIARLGGGAAIAGGAMTGAAGGAGVLATAASVLTGPIGIAIASVAALGTAAVVLDKELDKPVIKSKIFGDEVSKSTQKAVGAYLKMDEDASMALTNMFATQEVITDENLNSLVGKYDKMGNSILASMDKNHAKQLEKTQNLFANTSALTAEEEANVLKKMNDNHANKQLKVQEYEAKIQEIMNTAKEQKRALTESEKLTINGIQEQMRTLAVQTMSKSAEEQKFILSNLKEQSGVITAEQAAKVVQNSIKQRDKSVAEAEKQYKDTVMQITYMRDVTGELTTEQANRLIKEAERSRDNAVSTAEDMHKKVVEEAQGQAEEHVDKINWETGEVNSGWDMMWNKVDSIWTSIKELFGIKEKKKSAPPRVQKNVVRGAYAKGTSSSGHPEDGWAITSEKGRELIHEPGVGTYLSGSDGPELRYLRKGTSVLPNHHTEKLLKSYGFPGYEGGVGDYFDAIMKGPGALWDAVTSKVSDFKDSLIPEWFRKASGSPVKAIKELALKKIQTLIDDFSFGGFGMGAEFAGKGAAVARSAITQALKILNKPMSLLNPLMTIAQKESGFNPNAINNWDINAKRGDPSVGLFQVIGSTFKRWMMPGHGNRRNPLDSALAAIRYMDGRYGGVMGHPGIKSMSRGGGYKPYFKGGIASHPQAATLAENGYPEFILTTEPAYRDRNKTLWTQAGKALGMFDEKSSSTPLGRSSSYESEETALLKEQNQLLRKIAAKTTSFKAYVDQGVLMDFVETEQMNTIGSYNRMRG
ncbi:phage tail tape measure protein [Priestia flexa]|uniref:phage tail tape measure protein n=1 Tax=Priestia flexa TaxID=86664 RepID=UPI0013CF7CF6|nr:phage tail tape measure protein [Priestia flexa]